MAKVDRKMQRYFLAGAFESAFEATWLPPPGLEVAFDPPPPPPSEDFDPPPALDGAAEPTEEALLPPPPPGANELFAPAELPAAELPPTELPAIEEPPPTSE